MPPATHHDQDHDVPDLAVTVDGSRQITLDADAVADLPWHEHILTVSCASGNQYEATWAGVSVLDALDLAGSPDETTHVVVTAGDGYRVCMDLHTALDAILALTMDGTPIADTEPHATRLVAPRLDGTRTAKDVTRLEPVALAPGEHPEEHEDLHLGDA